MVRQVFFPLTPEILEFIDERGTDHLYSDSFFVGVDLEVYLPMLPDMEAEVLYLLRIKKKTQKDVARLLETSQPTVSYRYRRAIDKLSYLMAVWSANLLEVTSSLPLLKDKEKLVINALFLKANQELVGHEHGIRQSSVKWIFTKAKRYLAEAEQKEPEKWARHYGLMLLLEKNLRMRVFS